MIRHSIYLTCAVVTAWLLLTEQATATEIRAFQQGANGYAGATDQSFTFPGVAGNAAAATIRLDFPDASQPEGSYGYLRFDDLFGPGANQVPTSGVVLANATLSGFVTNRFGSANIHQLLQDISARPMSPDTLLSPGVSGVFFATAGATGIDASTTNTPVPPTPISWNVTSIVQAWLDGAPNLGMLLIPNTTDGGDIVSAEGALAMRPLLTIEFTQIPPAPEPGSLALLAGGAAWLFRRRRGVSSMSPSKA